MIYLLVKLARFVTQKEQDQLAKELNYTLGEYSNIVRIVNDTWGSRNRLLIQLPDVTKLSSKIRKTILHSPGVNTLVLFTKDNFEYETSSLSHLLTTLEDYISNTVKTNTVEINFQAFGRVPFHKKALLDRLKKKGILHQKAAKFHLYLEVKQDIQVKESIPIIKVRLGEKFLMNASVENKPEPPSLVLYSPYTTQEVADFFRLALTFNVNLLFTDENRSVKQVIAKVETTIFKGISKVKYRVVPSLTKILQENEKEGIFGFSLWGSEPIINLPKVIASTGKNTRELFFIFGNEETGIPLAVRKLVKMFYIGNKASEPLRASQAAAYALGLLKI